MAKSFARLLTAAAPLCLLIPACSAQDDHDADGPNPAAISAWEDAYEQTELGKADTSGCSGVVVPDSGGFDKRVALTFDDGPNPETTPQVLDILKKYSLKATFFINGMRVSGEAARAVLDRILAEGHILANHSHNHKNMKTLSNSQVDDQVRLTHEIISTAGATPRYFRFPFGSASCAAKGIVESYGYIVTGWHIDSADWCYAASTGGVGHCAQSTFRYVPDSFRNDMVGYTLHQVRKKNGGILLFHDIHQNTANAVEPIVTQLIAEGFSFVNVDDSAAFPVLNGEPPQPTPFVGDVCTTTADCGFSDSGKAGTCHLFTPSGASQESGFCSLGCEGFCPDKSGKAPTFCTSLDGGTTGSCVSKVSSLNDQCAKIPGTSAQSASRFIGGSSASPSTAMVCLPN